MIDAGITQDTLDLINALNEEMLELTGGQMTAIKMFNYKESDMNGENPYKNKEMNTDATDAIVVREVDGEKVKLLISNLKPEVADLIQDTIKHTLRFVKLVS